MAARAQSVPQPTPLVATQCSTHSEPEGKEDCNVQPATPGCTEEENAQRAEPTSADQQVCPHSQNTQTLNNIAGAPPQASRLSVGKPDNPVGQPENPVKKAGMTASAAAHAEKAKCNVSTDSGGTAEQRVAPVTILASGEWTLHGPKTLAA